MSNRGRPRLDMSQKEMDAHKRKLAEERNARRRERYAEDGDYKEREREAARERKRAANGTTQRFDCRTNLDNLDALGEDRAVHWDGEVYTWTTFTADELAEALGSYVGRNVRRWIARDQLPTPVLSAEVVTGAFGRSDGTSVVEVFHVDEVRAIIEVFGPHQEKFNYFRQDHRETIEGIAAAVAKAREEIGIG